MNVYGRAELQRTVVVVVALPVAADATHVLAREFRAADTKMMRALSGPPVELPYGQVLTGLATRLLDGAGRDMLAQHAIGPDIPMRSPMAWGMPSQRDPAKPIERIGKVE